MGQEELLKTIRWAWDNYYKSYFIYMNGDKVHCSKDEMDRDLFISTLKARIILGEN